jgi:hypothetical protein
VVAERVHAHMISNREGEHVLRQILPGNYMLAVEATHFKNTSVRRNSRTRVTSSDGGVITK